MIPKELRSRPQWVAWRLETRNGKATKVPYTQRGRRASSTDSSTWSTYRQALGVVDADGIGFVFSPDDPFAGVDMDGCVGATGALHRDAYSITRALDGYVEFSPSGRGLHIIVRGVLGKGRRTKRTPWRGDIEVYDRGRFFSVTGDGRGLIREAQSELMELVSFYFPSPRDAPSVARPKPISDDDAVIVDRLLADPRLAALWRGETADHGGDSSAADLALCAHLAFFCGPDAARIDGLFRRSGLYRPKWLEARGDMTYGQITIERAIRDRL